MNQEKGVYADDDFEGEVVLTTRSFRLAAFFKQGTNDLFLLTAEGWLLDMRRDLVVVFPVKNYFLCIDDLPESKKCTLFVLMGMLLYFTGVLWQWRELPQVFV